MIACRHTMVVPLTFELSDTQSEDKTDALHLVNRATLSSLEI